MKIEIGSEMREILTLASSPWWAKELHSTFGQTEVGCHSSVTMSPCTFSEVSLLAGDGIEIEEIDEIEFQGAGVGGKCHSKVFSVNVLGTGYQYMVLSHSGFIVDHKAAWEKWCKDNHSTTLDKDNLQYQKILLRG